MKCAERCADEISQLTKPNIRLSELTELGSAISGKSPKNMNNSKSDDEFEIQHLRIKEKIFNDLKESTNRHLNEDRTTTYLNNWNRNVNNKKKLIHKIKHKTKNKKCILLERDTKHTTEDRKVNLLITARNSKCVQEEFHGIPQYIKQNELFIKSCQEKRRHDHCKEEYINKQLQVNNAADLREVNKYPSFDQLIVIGQKIEREKCMNNNTKEELREEIMDEESVGECDEEQAKYIRSDEFENCSDVYTFFDTAPKEYKHDNVIIDFIDNLIACNIAREIFDSIINDIFEKYNVYYLKMMFSAYRFEVISEVFENEMENMETDSLENIVPIFKQTSAMRDFPQEIDQPIKATCDFTRSSDYMLHYIENKDKFIFQEKNSSKGERKSLNNINEDEKLVQENRIKSYLYNVLLSIEDNVNQLERSIGIINGYKEKTPGPPEPSTTNSKSMERQSVVSYRSKGNMSRISQINKNKELAMALWRETQLQKRLETEVRNSNLFRAALTLQCRYIILETIDYVCEVLSS
ncbi:hypothetical protein WDU94_013307 [Cyamophila willieti]